jgi:malic enzyme
MINAGIGEQQMNNILAFMNLPTVNKGTLKTREREIGQSIETVAVQSCSRAVKEEILSSE